MKSGVILKQGKEKAIKNRHHWIFSGAIQSLPEFNEGDILQIFSSNGELLGCGYFNRKAKIIGRVICFNDANPLSAIFTNIDRALALRKILFDSSKTNAYRLINAEGDLLPGLIVDKYGDVIVIQISTLGIEKLKSQIVKYLSDAIQPIAIYEKSVLPSRKEEGLLDHQELLMGTLPDRLVILENGLQFVINIPEGQKTGFFLDHREMRNMVRNLSSAKTVLNCFSYTGGFSVYAAAGGAKQVTSVDISKTAVDLAKQNMELNNFNGTYYADDVFEFLRKQDLNYDLIILDPPAFAKKQKDIVQACRGYKDINRLAMKKMPPKSWLVTCSCSYYVDEELFKKVLFQASVEADRSAKIISRHHLASDHPINLCHPESDYLKSYLLYIE